MTADTPGGLPRWQRAYVVTCLAILGGAFAYWLPAWAQAPILTYLPLERRWTFDPKDHAPTIVYFGLLLWGACGAVAGAALGAAFGRLWRRPLPAPVLRLLAAWAVTGFVLTGWYYTWNLWPF
ncbi:MAG TPA: hypothetical protein PKU97_18835 [Kofleriaceae bacterium]|nr:hypothetical protein [Kofleriaceae bacterium]